MRTPLGIPVALAFSFLVVGASTGKSETLNGNVDLNDPVYLRREFVPGTGTVKSIIWSNQPCSQGEECVRLAFVSYLEQAQDATNKKFGELSSTLEAFTKNLPEALASHVANQAAMQKIQDLEIKLAERDMQLKQLEERVKKLESETTSK